MLTCAVSRFFLTTRNWFHQCRRGSSNLHRWRKCWNRASRDTAIAWRWSLFLKIHPNF